MTVDDALTPEELRATALSLRLTADDIASVQAPVARFGTSATGQSIDVVDTAQLKQLAEALRDDTMASSLQRNPE